MTNGATKRTLPLSGVRVIDFSRVLAGPFCTMLLADLGAEVIKIEQPGSGDETRAWGPPWVDEAARLSAYFASVNRNKRSMTLNLKQPQAQAIARRLAHSAQVVVENFKVGQMASFGLGAADLLAQHPALVYCSITGFGQTGPDRHRPGYDYIIQALSGLMSITGPADSEPHKVGVAVSDVFTGLFASNAIQAALRHAERTSQGQHIDLALLDSQVAALVNIASNYLVSGEVPLRLGNQHPNIAPYQTFNALDGPFVLAVGNDRQFVALCEVLERPDLAVDPRFATNPARVEHRTELIAILADAFSVQPVMTWVERVGKVGIPASPIRNVAQALEAPEARARGLVQQIDANGQPLRLVASPIRLDDTSLPIRNPPPPLGADTDPILQHDLGFSKHQIAEMRHKGII